ncbi:mechanosensitive ion channel family protein [Halobacteriovorax vibrionivorans]|uniref:Mechanosensitive ion channel family protein n=2 Tax=Halobacteriovoraceae TaxID=1652132 RepID=A0ABY0IF24_9BACT|nr:mechanosensitive ion channel family protein [Halobacteriovorax vibrionivorans]TGD46589.1 mechanosensitive ion channel family protein [Halobacteriovorax sp. Y22]
MYKTFIQFFLILLTICKVQVLANEIVPLDLSTPRATMNYYLKNMKAYKLGNNLGLEYAIKTFDGSYLPESVREVKLKDYAQTLITVLDRIEYIDVKKIPKKPNTDIWYYRKSKVHVDGDDHQVEISLQKFERDEKIVWLFTEETTKSLYHYDLSLRGKQTAKDVVYSKSIKDRLKEYLPPWTFHQRFLLLNIHWILLIIITLISFVFDRIVRHYIAVKAISILKKRNISFTEKQQNRLTAPFGIVTFVYIFKTLCTWIDLPTDALVLIIKACDIIFAVAMIMILNELLTVICLYLEDKARDTENKFDDIIVPLVRKTARFFIFAVGIIFIGDALELDMKSILAGMGIGGIAFALAAKDTISNLFGSFTVLFDNPFTIGDWVKINDDIEGIVEEVGMRSTRIRTFYNSVLSVPNGTLINANIDNLGRRRYRRFNTNLGIDYATPPEKIENFCESIRQIIIAHPFTRKDNFQVYFNGMGASSLNILVYMFWEVPSWDDELHEKHKFLLDILKVARKHGINFAFPTQTLHVQKDPGVTYSPEEVNFEMSKQVAKSLENERWHAPNRSSIDRLK